MKICILYSILLFLVVACRTPTSGALRPTRINIIILDSLVANDLSEDMSRLSTHEDEVYAFAFVHDRQTVKQHWNSDELSFTTNEKPTVIDHEMIGLGADDRCTFFLLELDNETLPPTTASMLESWVLSPDFPESFQLLRADSLLGDDDLLGVQSFKLTEVPKPPLIFKGRQLFDVFRYELYFTTAME